MKPDDQNTSPVVSEARAKQGLWGGRILLVLVCALALAMIVWWGAEIYGDAIEPPASEQIGDPSSVELPPADRPSVPPAGQLTPPGGTPGNAPAP